MADANYCLEAANLAVTFSIPKIDLTATSSSFATGSVTYTSAKTVNPLTGTSCHFYFINPKPDGMGEGVLAGQIWGAFACPDGITYGSSNPPVTCDVGQSFFAFENCSTTAM